MLTALPTLQSLVDLCAQLENSPPSKKDLAQLDALVAQMLGLLGYQGKLDATSCPGNITIVNERYGA